jgi:hypothetical protein
MRQSSFGVLVCLAILGVALADKELKCLGEYSWGSVFTFFDPL